MTHTEFLKMMEEQYDENGMEKNQPDVLAKFRMTHEQYERYINR